MAMKFEKRLIILSGDNGAKGSLTLERNAYGFFASINIFNLPDLVNGEYAVGIKNKQHYFSRKLGSSGRITTRIQLEDTELTNIHCVIFDTLNERPLLYGTCDNVKLWQANMMDGFRTKKAIAISLGEGEHKPFEYSTRPKEIESYFLDVVSKGEYADTAVAAVNYYPNDMSIEVAYSSREEEAKQIQNPIDRMHEAKEHFINQCKGQNDSQKAIDDSAAHKSCQENGNKITNTAHTILSEGELTSEHLAPHELQKRYINRYSTYQNTFKEQNEQTQNIKTYSKTHTSGQINSDLDFSAREQFNNTSRVYDEAESIHKKARAAMPAADAETKKRISQPKEAFKKDTYNEAKINTLSNDEASEADEVASSIPSPSSYIPERALGKNIAYVFYEQVKPQIDELFKANPPFELLEKIMPDTKWTKVDYDNDGKYYVVGLIGTKPDYLCYGVPATYSAEPPQELDGYCQWLPLEEDAPEGEGFWLMFQDALSGESVK